MAAKKSVELFYDVLSPYSWIAFELLLRCQSSWNIHLDLQPVLLAGIMKESGNTPPGLNPAKGSYLVKDIKRLFKYHSLGSICFPQDPVDVLMVKGSLPAMRFLTAAKITLPGKLESLSRELWTRVYQTDEDIVAHNSLLKVGRKTGLTEAELEQLLEESKSEAVKNKLRQTTQRALDHGAFGAPIILVDAVNGSKEMIFGCDRFHIIAHILGVERPVL